jgi:hypothetical protein
LIYKGFFALSKNLADWCFAAFFSLKAGLSTAVRRKATDRFKLSRTGVHFCTFYVDKIVSKAQVTIPSP